ncbi:uncharacterized protein [Drosophila virilis]|uniref:Peptidase S1 domain-containing protein n=1 Tax=Drosophila virilis TaxID=7244 RepID=B4M190_DROVI|nr:uncharacterized protein LOC6629683 [Drosophila virilis]EDW67501.2 uncharacterized protein Dvir_GJ24183 [Drosophila virilis]
MLLSTLLRFVLLLAIASSIVAQKKILIKSKKVRKLYGTGDWVPHFGYIPSHAASQHSHRRRQKNTILNVNVETDNFQELSVYVARILIKDKLFCSGLVVSSQTVLTVKMCMHDKLATDVVVKLSDGSLHKVANRTDTQDFTMSKTADMLTLLSLQDALGAQFVREPPICTNPVPLSEKVEQWNWDKNLVSPKKILASLIPSDRCKEIINDPNGMVVTPGIDCVENKKITKKCEKTFGLPYVSRGSFCGMNLLGHNCPNASSADVYVNLLKKNIYIGATLSKVLETNLEDNVF